MTFEEQAKELLFKIDYDLAKELDYDNSWEDSTAFKEIIESLEQAYQDGFSDYVAQIERTS